MVRSRLTEEIAEARAEAQAALAALSEERKPRFESDVFDALARADELAKQNPPDTEGATAATMAARVAHAGILANALEDDASALRRPESFTESKWNALQSELAEHLKSAQSGTDPDAARSGYEAAYGVYLQIVIGAARLALTDVQARVPADRDESLQQLAAATANLDLAEQRQKRGEAAEANNAYNLARRAIDAVAKAFPPAQRMRQLGRDVARGGLPPGDESSLVSVGALAAPLRIATASALSPVVRREAKRWLSVDEVDAEIVNRDRLVTLAIGVLAIVLGFYLIWLDNVAWGTPKDFFAAFFWGVGMHQVAGNAIFSKLDLDQLEKQVTGKT